MRSAIVAVLGVFALNGVVFGSWAPRVPALAAQIGAEEGALGLSLLGASIGMIASALLAGSLCARYGARLMLLISGVAGCVVLPALGVATSPLQLGLILFALGVSVGVYDVAMNVAAVTAIRQSGRAIMPVFHAGFSIGAMLGALGAAAAAALELNPLRHLAIIGVLGVVVAVLAARSIPVEDLTPSSATPGPKRPLVRRPVLWLLGFIALCSSVAEGASADWSAFFGVHERGIGESSAALIYAGFAVFMAAARLLGERIESRWGSQRMLIGGSTIGALGLLITVLVPVPAFTFIGFALAGMGLAYGFPVALELAGAVGRRADGGGGEREIGFVTTIAYSGFLLGPPMIGGIASATSLSVALGIAGAIAWAMAPLTLLATRARRHEQQTRQQAVETAAA